MATIKVSLSGMTRNSASFIDAAVERLRAALPDDEFESLCLEYQPESFAFMLRELSRHATETADGKHSVEQFAEFYGLTSD